MCMLISCDLLEKSYFCSITNIESITRSIGLWVVICLKNRTFAVSQTSCPLTRSNWPQLWFAWKIVLLQYHKHLANPIGKTASCCDLLEKSYFCSITNIDASLLPLSMLVVICLKNRTFAVSQTSNIVGGIGYTRLWFAWKIVLLQYHKHPNLRTIIVVKVVICLKNRTFAVSQTSDYWQTYSGYWLWFAWKIVLLQYHKHQQSNCIIFWRVVICLKIVLLQYHKHPTNISSCVHRCCDLLEKSYFCSITNILTTMIVLKFVLWFAWKIVLLQYHKHHYRRIKYHGSGCDLLEKSYFCSITNIKPISISPKRYVVICLKNRTFAVSQTSPEVWVTSPTLLWFAWKIVLLQYHKHRPKTKTIALSCCDLLEKSYFCSITNISIFKNVLKKVVVICLKNRTFAVSQTSLTLLNLRHIWLWFAWKIVLLQYHKHPPITGLLDWICCDLLEKSYFCSITNITVRGQCFGLAVVICLKNRTFAVSQTSYGQ